MERARVRRHEHEERKTARFMAFLITLWTGKECKAEDILAISEPELTEEEEVAHQKIIAAYRSQGEMNSF